MARIPSVDQRWFILAGFVFSVALVAPAAAQEPPAPPDPNPGRITLTGSFDVVSTYMFRGIRQHSTGIALWPVADLGFALYLGRWRRQERGRQRGDMEQPAHRRHRPGRTDRKAVVRIGFLRDAEPRVWWRHESRHDVYRLYQSKQRLYDRKGDCVQVRRRRQRTPRQSGAQAVCAGGVRVRYCTRRRASRRREQRWRLSRARRCARLRGPESIDERAREGRHQPL